MDAKTEVALTRVPDPRRGRSSALFRTFRSLLVSFLLALLLVAVGITYAKREFERAGPLIGVGAVVVERGMNAEDIANRLKEKGVIAHSYAFVLDELGRKVRLRRSGGRTLRFAPQGSPWTNLALGPSNLIAVSPAIRRGRSHR